MAHDEVFSLHTVQEKSPHVDDVPGMTPEQYVQLISKRFANPDQRHRQKVAFDGGARHGGFCINHTKSDGKRMQVQAVVEALWARMCEGTRGGSVIEPNDPSWSFYQRSLNVPKTRQLFGWMIPMYGISPRMKRSGKYYPATEPYLAPWG